MHIPWFLMKTGSAATLILVTLAQTLGSRPFPGPRAGGAGGEPFETFSARVALAACGGTCYSHPFRPVAGPAARPASLLDSLGIRSRGRSRQFCYTNKAGAFFYGESNGASIAGWEGFTVEGHNYLEDYVLEIDGAPLDRLGSVATVFPDFLRREYPGGIVEELRPADSIAALTVTIVSPHPVEVKIVPFIQGSRTGADLETVGGESSITIARRNHMRRTAAENYPVWLSLCAPGFAPSKLTAVRAGAFSPGSLVAPRGKTHTIAIATGDSPEESLRLAGFAAGAWTRLAQSRRARMESLLSSTATRTSDERFDRALAWAKLSLDALTVSGGGIYAGLPWFADYWGRDTFISLPGEALVTGRFAEAGRILGLFALFQQRDSLSSDYGRIPNRVTATDTAYNTADGTPRFVMIAKEYAERSGDRRFARGDDPLSHRLPGIPHARRRGDLDGCGGAGRTLESARKPGQRRTGALECATRSGGVLRDACGRCLFGTTMARFHGTPERELPQVFRDTFRDRRPAARRRDRGHDTQAEPDFHCAAAR